MKFLKFNHNVNRSLSDDEARRLTVAFLDGSTTPEEERELYNYYGGKRVAPDLECYSQMFAWYDNLENSASTKTGSRHNTRFFAAAAAIAALMLVGVGLTIGISSDNSEPSLDRIYAGSYIIRNGKKITDIKEILPELQKADRIVDSTLTASILNYPDNPDLVILNEALKNIKDPDVKAMLLADLN